MVCRGQREMDSSYSYLDSICPCFKIMDNLNERFKLTELLNDDPSNQSITRFISTDHQKP